MKNRNELITFLSYAYSGSYMSPDGTDNPGMEAYKQLNPTNDFNIVIELFDTNHPTLRAWVFEGILQIIGEKTKQEVLDSMDFLKVNSIVIELLKDSREIETIFGPKECIRIKPITIDGQFFSSTDAMVIWLTNDEKLIPVKFSVDLKIGALHGALTSYNSSGNKDQ